MFVLGGIIPGIGKRNYYVFSKISLNKNRLNFIKDNTSTTFIGTPMYTKENNCQVYVKNGGLQVEMTNYYANWAGIGNMTMAEGWAIDYIDLDKGVVGLQLELDISGLFTLEKDQNMFCLNSQMFRRFFYNQNRNIIFWKRINISIVHNFNQFHLNIAVCNNC